MSKTCGAPHPDDPSRTCISKSDTHGDHGDRQGLWPRPERVALVKAFTESRRSKKRTRTLRSLGQRAREGKKRILAGDTGPGIPAEIEGRWVADEWHTYAGQIIEDFLKQRRDDFTTAEDVWPLLDRPEEMRAMSVLIQGFLREGYIEEVAAKRLRGTYRTKDGFEFAENKLVPVYRSRVLQEKVQPSWGNFRQTDPQTGTIGPVPPPTGS